MDLGTVEEQLRSLVAEADDVYKLPSRVRGDIRFLIDELASVQAFSQRLADLPVDQLDRPIKEWAWRVRDVFYDTEHVVDDFRARASARRENPPGLKGFVAKIKFKLTTAKARRRFAANIREVKCRLVELVERRQRYNIDHSFSVRGHITSTVVDPRLRALYVDPVTLVGIDGPTEELVNLLTEEGSTSKQQIKVASIVGLGGVGKTTLAMQVYSRLARTFDCAALVSVSAHPNMRNILRHMLIQISQNDRVDFDIDFEEVDERQLIDKIRETLKGKRYFVIVDDIWDEELWDLIKIALVENNCGSAVLTTTRKVGIAYHIGGVYKLEPLSTIDSTNLFKARLFHPEDNFPVSLEEISHKIIEKCGGVPLAIITTAGLLASKPFTMEAWHAVHDSNNYGDMRSILALSYTDLPSNLKPCLLYLSMFQKGHEISGEHLIWGWIAEGFIHEQRAMSLQEVGELYLGELINRSLIEPVEVDGGGKALSCRVHGIVHDLIISLSTEENFVTILDGQQDISMQNVRRLSIQGNILEHPMLQVHLPHVRSLVVSSDATVMPPLSNFQDLRVLDLEGCDSLQNDHLKGVENSFNLRYVVIGGKCITDIPKEIGTLPFLQTLDLRATGIKELPESIVQLRQLKRLLINRFMKIPGGIGKIEALEELGDINISKLNLLKDLCYLIHLRVLRMAIWSWDESYDDVLLEYLRSLSMRRQNIQSLSILTCCSLHFLDKLDAKWVPQSVQKLEIRCSAFLQLPRWFCSLDHLSSLSIEVFKLSQEIIDLLGKMDNLHCLSLTSNHAPEGRFGNGIDNFNRLVDLHFVSNAMGKMFEAGAMQMLKRLKLVFEASQTRDVNQGFIFGLENLSSLQHVRVDIICFSASIRVVEDAEVAIREAIPRVKPDIQRVREEDMIENDEEEVVCGINQENDEEEVVRDIKQEQKKKQKNKRKIRVATKKFHQKKKGVAIKYKIISLQLRSQILTLQAL